MNAIVPLPVLLPLIGAAFALLFGRHAVAQRVVSLLVLGAVPVLATFLLVAADRHGPVVLTLGGWSAPLGITLVVDRLSGLMLLVSSLMLFAVMVYAIGQTTDDDAGNDEDHPISIFHPTYLILATGVNIAFLAGDLFNLFVGFEVLLSSSYVLLTLGGSAARIRAGTTYVVVSLLSSIVFLTGIGLVYSAAGTLNMAQLAERLPGLSTAVQIGLQAVLLVAFGIKAAVFPLSAWLPDSYPTAPAPVTAVFAGLLTKVGVYAIIRTDTLLFPAGRLDDVLLVLALATMVVGILGAVAQQDLKRMLSFTLVSHIGYMIFGVALATRAGLAGAVFYVVHHITVQTTLFLVVGLIERTGGATSARRLGGLARTAPVVAILFFVPAMNLAGIPPFSGFIGKAGLVEAGVQDGSVLAWALVAGSLVTSLLTLFAIAKFWGRAFWRPREEAVEDAEQAVADGVADGRVSERQAAVAVAEPATSRAPFAMTGATAALVALGLVLTIAGGPLYGLAQRAAGDLLDRAVYIQAVNP